MLDEESLGLTVADGPAVNCLFHTSLTAKS